MWPWVGSGRETGQETRPPPENRTPAKRGRVSAGMWGLDLRSSVEAGKDRRCGPDFGFSADGTRWISSRRKGFPFPVRILSSYFRGRFITLLRGVRNQIRLPAAHLGEVFECGNRGSRTTCDRSRVAASSGRTSFHSFEVDGLGARAELSPGLRFLAHCRSWVAPGAWRRSQDVDVAITAGAAGLVQAMKSCTSRISGGLTRSRQIGARLVGGRKPWKYGGRARFTRIHQPFFSRSTVSYRE